jgi:hypothetical protein
MDATTRVALEVLYEALIAAVHHLARALGKPSPIVTRAERRAASQAAAQRREGALHNG